MKKYYKRLLSVFLMIVMLNSTIVYPVVAQGITIAKSEKSKKKKSFKKNKNENSNIKEEIKQENDIIKEKKQIKKNKGKETEKNKERVKTDRFIVKYKNNKEDIDKNIKEDIKSNKNIKSFVNNFIQSDINSKAFRDEAKDKQTLKGRLKGNIKESKQLKNKKYDLIVTDSEITINELQQLASTDDNIEYIIPDYKMKLMSNDTYYDDQWGLKYILKNNNPLDILNSTTSGAISISGSTTSGAIQINDSTTSSAIKIDTQDIESENPDDSINIEDFKGEGVIIGVIDTGIDISHKDLYQNIWINEYEVQDGIDNDNNGYVDDINGWNFVDNSNNVFNNQQMQSENHGTHIAGIISAVEGNRQGIAGVTSKSKIMPLKVFENGEAYTSDIIQAIEYAKSKNVKIMNCSWGSEHENPILRDVIEASGMLFIFPAGNQGENIDNKPFYPAAYDSENIITVGSINKSQELADNSNYGQSSVDVFAPGEKIISTLPNHQYGYMSGTSIAAAFVSGGAALILGAYNDIEISQLRDAIIESSISVPMLSDGKVINCFSALKYLKENPPKDDLDELILIIQILKKHDKISEFTKADLNTILDFYDVKLDIVIECEEKGYNVRVAIDIAILVEKFGFSIEEIEQLMHLYGDYTHTSHELLKFNLIKESLCLTADEYNIFKEYLLKGYKQDYIEDAFIVSNAIDIPIEKIITNDIGVNQQDIIKNIIDKYSKKDREIIDFILEFFSVNVTSLLEFINIQGYSLEDTKEKIVNYHNDRLREGDGKYILQSDDLNQGIKYEKYFNSPFSIDSGINESISPNSGTLTYEKNILNLPGRNGLDLNINAKYLSSNANLFEADYDIDNEYRYYVKVGYTAELLYILNGDEDISDWSEKNIRPRVEYLELTRKEADELVNEIDGMESEPEFVEMWGNGEAYVIYTAYAKKQRYLSSSTQISKRLDTSFTEAYNRLGAGWSLGFSRIEPDRGPDYLCLSDGSKYKINITSTVGDSNLENYTLNDIRIEEDYNETFSNGEAASFFILYYKNGNREYFASDGRLLGIKDRYDNTITFYHTEIEGYNVITKIVDTLGREINISYDDLSETRKKVTFSLPDNKSVLLFLESAYGYPDKFVLKKIVDQEYRSIIFDYSIDEGEFSFFEKYDRDTYNEFANLITIEYPTGATTSYDYEKTVGNLGIDGSYEYYRITSRKDLDNEKESNVQKFNYGDKEFTGYEEYDEPSDLPDNFTYTTIIAIGNKKEKMIFNNKHLITKVQSYVDNKLKSEINNTYDDNKQLELKKHKKFNNNNARFIENTENFIIDSKGNLIEYTGPQAKRTGNNPINDDFTVKYSYHDSYNILTKKEYYRDSGKKIIESYSLKPDKKNVDMITVKENGVLKSKAAYDYDSYGNIIRVKKYGKNDDWNNYIETINDYNGNTGRGAYVTSTKTLNISNPYFGTDEEIITQYQYDDLGRVKRTITPKGYAVSYIYDRLGRLTEELNETDGAKVKIRYNDSLNLTNVTDENGNIFRCKYDRFGQVIDIKNGKDNSVIKHYEYDDLGRVKTEKISDKGYIRYSYYSDNRVKFIEVYEQDKSKDRLLTKTEYIYEDVIVDEDSGELVSRVTEKIHGDADSPSIITREIIDRYGRTIRREALDGEKVYKETYKYDISGNVIENKRKRVFDENWTEAYTQKFSYNYDGTIDKIYDHNNEYLEYIYNKSGQVVKFRDKKNTSSNKPIYLENEYDEIGRLIREQIPFEENEGIVKNREKRLAYDKHSNNIVSKTLIGEVEKIPKYNEYVYEYDHKDRLDTVKINDGIKDIYTQYFYDNMGNLLNTVTGLESKITSVSDNISVGYTYDELSNQKSRTSQTDNIKTYDYDNYGNIEEVADSNNNNIFIVYDGLNRIKTKTIKDKNNQVANVYSYSYTLTGRVKSITSNASTKNFKYDNLGRLFEINDSRGYKSIYRYDSEGNLKNLKVTKENITIYDVSYLYDKFNRLEHVEDGSIRIASYTYDKNGNRATMSYNNGVRVVYGYNLANRLTKVENYVRDTLISKYEYDHRPDGTIIEELVYEKGNLVDTKSFEYDDIGRLKSEKGKYAQNVYEYDNFHNRKTQESISNKNINNLLKPVTYGYDSENRLSSVKLENISSSYTYDEAGNRISKVVNGEKTDYVYSNGHVAIEDKENGDVIKNIRGIGLTVRKYNDKTVYYLYDGYGNVTHLLDQSGNIIKKYKYDGFGNEINRNENDNNPYRYRGSFYDKESNLYYLNARYYDPVTGRFISEDSYQGEIGNPVSLNLYTYSYNNPVNLKDPSGNRPDPGYDVEKFYADYHGTYAEYSYDRTKSLKAMAGVVIKLKFIWKK